MKSKAKDTLVIIIALLIIGGSIFAALRLLNPPKPKSSVTSEADKIKAIPTAFDEKTFERINSLADYGEPVLENLGKSDLFANF